MQALVDGIHHFQKVGFPQQRELFERLANGQSPDACLITCCDSRIDPALIFGSKPGQLFIVRCIGNIVPCHGTANNAELAAVEYAISALKVKDIIVCGHTKCGAMGGLINPEALGDMEAVRDWLRHGAATSAILKEHYSHLSGDALLNAAAQENVLVQLEHIRTLPIVASRVSKGRVNLHGWMYKIETGELFAYDSEERQFLPFTVNESVLAAG